MIYPPDMDADHYDLLVLALDMLIGNVDIPADFAEQLEELMISMDLFSDDIRQTPDISEQILDKTDNLIKVDFGSNNN